MLLVLNLAMVGIVKNSIYYHHIVKRFMVKLTDCCPPRLLFILNIVLENTQEIQICSDQTWSGRQGSILHDSIYNGEIIDARYERSHWSEVDFHDRLSLWLTPEIMPSPIDMNLNGQYTFQDMPPIRVGNDALHSEINISSEYMNEIIGASLYDGGILKPISVSTPVSGIHIFDLGQNMVGWCRIHFHGSRGIAVQIRHAEILTPPVISTRKSSELPYVENLRSATQADIYILQGDANGELYEPRFTVHGFRYISVFGSPNSLSLNDVECPVVHSETTVKGYFTTSNEVINQIQHNIQWSQLNNLMSIPTDCPQRDERKGWLGDASLSINEALYNFDLNKFYINFLNLIIDIQRKDGSIPDTVPFTSGSYPADPNWGTALPTIVWQLYRHYQDRAILQTYHKHIRAYIESVHSDYNKTGLIKLNYHYGDWVSPPPHPMTNVHLISSFAFLHDVYILINISQILAIDEDIKVYSELYQQLTDEFHRVFYTSSAGYYADGMQAAQILALALPNVVPNEIRQYVVEYLVKNIHDQGDHITTGIISTAQLFTVLSDNGYHDLSVELISSITYPSYGYMFNNPYENATTLWELWDAPFEGAEMNSRNHIMFGSIGSWFYTHLAGIEYQSDMIIIRPRMVSERKKYLLDRIHCQISTLYGLVDVSYTRNEKDTFSNSILLQITIPSNMKAKIIFEPLFPHAQCVLLTEGDKIIWSDVQGNINDKDYDVLYNSDTKLMVVQINSGHYEYQAFWS
ncbi:hypothetical protein I4U23_013666 [Adineta vaga]|nr:hypothetical protein I4U23_013666 [Adineta vaga]